MTMRKRKIERGIRDTFSKTFGKHIQRSGLRWKRHFLHLRYVDGANLVLINKTRKELVHMVT